MVMNTYNPKNEITCTYTNEKYIIIKFLNLLFNKTIVNSKHIKKIKYNYNYSDKQKITFIFDNGYKQEFCDIPTQWGLLNDCEITKLLKGGE